MKTFKTFIPLTVGLLLMGCANNDITDDNTLQQTGNQQDATTFVGKNYTGKDDKQATRTYLSFIRSTPSTAKFIWNPSDKVYMSDGSSATAEVASTADMSVADFTFKGKSLTAPSYDIYYPGANATAYNKVHIPDTNNGRQLYPYSYGLQFSISDGGDCGFAKATKQPDGKYYFELEHQAAYIILYPRSNAANTDQVSIKSIKVTADTNISGDYTLTPSGLIGSGSSKTVSSQARMLLTSTIAGTGEVIDGTKTQDRNAMLFTIAPCTTALTIEYTLRNYDGSIAGTVTKQLPVRTYAKNTITPITANLQVPEVGYYYTWDAAEGQHYWKGYEKEQYSGGGNTPGSGNHYPENSSDARWYNTASNTATRSAKDCPNLYEISWYVAHGDPHWDAEMVWTNGGDLYKGGMWFKKKAYITGFSNTTYPAGFNPPSTMGSPTVNTSIAQGRPTDTSEYFFLPAASYYMRGQISRNYGEELGELGTYWSNTFASAYPGDTGSDPYNGSTAYCLNFSSNRVDIGIYPKCKCGVPLWTAQ